MAVNIRFNADTTRYDSAVAKINRSLKDLGYQANKSTSNLTRLSASKFGSLQSGIERSASAVERLEARSASAVSTMRRLLGVFTLISTAGFGSAMFIKYGDDLKGLENRVALVTGRNDKLGESMRELEAIAFRSRSGMQNLVETYSRFGLALRGNSNYGQEELLKVTETIAKASTLSGGDPESIRAAIFQLGQGIASGQLRGQELNSVLEQSQRIATAIADELGVGTGALRELAEDGKITAEVVMRALLNQAEKINTEFALLEPTVANSLTLLNLGFGKFIAKLDDSLGYTDKLSDTFNFLGSFFYIQSKLIGKDIEYLKTKFSEITGVVATVASAIYSTFIAPVIGYFSETIDAVVALSSNLWAKVSGFFGEFFGNLKALFWNFYVWLVGNSVWPDTIDGIVNYVKNLWGRVAPEFKAFGDKIRSLFTGIAKSVNESITSIKPETMKDIFTSGTAAVVMMIKFTQALRGLASPLFLLAPLLILFNTSFVELVASIMLTLTDKELWKNIFTYIKGAFATTFREISAIFTVVKSFVSDSIDVFISNISSFFSTAKQVVYNLGGLFLSLSKTMITGAATLAVSFFGTISDSIDKGINYLSQGTIVNDISSGIAEILTTAFSAVSNISIVPAIAAISGWLVALRDLLQRGVNTLVGAIRVPDTILGFDFDTIAFLFAAGILAALNANFRKLAAGGLKLTAGFVVMATLLDFKEVYQYLAILASGAVNFFYELLIGEAKSINNDRLTKVVGDLFIPKEKDERLIVTASRVFGNIAIAIGTGFVDVIASTFVSYYRKIMPGALVKAAKETGSPKLIADAMAQQLNIDEAFVEQIIRNSAGTVGATIIAAALVYFIGPLRKAITMAFQYAFGEKSINEIGEAIMGDKAGAFQRRIMLNFAAMVAGWFAGGALSKALGQEQGTLIAYVTQAGTALGAAIVSNFINSVLDSRRADHSRIISGMRNLVFGTILGAGIFEVLKYSTDLVNESNYVGYQIGSMVAGTLLLSFGQRLGAAIWNTNAAYAVRLFFIDVLDNALGKAWNTGRGRIIAAVRIIGYAAAGLVGYYFGSVFAANLGLEEGSIGYYATVGGMTLASMLMIPLAQSLYTSVTTMAGVVATRTGAIITKAFAGKALLAVLGKAAIAGLAGAAIATWYPAIQMLINDYFGKELLPNLVNSTEDLLLLAATGFALGAVGFSAVKAIGMGISALITRGIISGVRNAAAGLFSAAGAMGFVPLAAAIFLILANTMNDTGIAGVIFGDENMWASIFDVFFAAGIAFVITNKIFKNKAKGLVAAVMVGIGQALRDYDGTMGELESGFNVLDFIGDVIMGAAAGAFAGGTVGGPKGAIAGAIINGVLSGLKHFPETEKMIFEWVGSLDETIQKAIANMEGMTAQDWYHLFSKGMSFLGGLVIDLGKWVYGKFKEGFLYSVDFVVELGKEAGQSIATLANDFYNWGVDLGNRFVDGVVDAVKTLAAKIGSILPKSSIDNIAPGKPIGETTGEFPSEYATGGFVSGPGTGTSDSIPAMLSNGEFVINAEATKKFLPLLQSINNGSYGHFADGGYISQLGDIDPTNVSKTPIYFERGATAAFEAIDPEMASETYNYLGALAYQVRENVREALGRYTGALLKDSAINADRSIGDAYYDSWNSIMLAPKIAYDDTMDEYLAVNFHELGHALGAKFDYDAIVPSLYITPLQVLREEARANALAKNFFPPSMTLGFDKLPGFLNALGASFSSYIFRHLVPGIISFGYGGFTSLFEEPNIKSALSNISSLEEISAVLQSLMGVDKKVADELAGWAVSVSQQEQSFATGGFVSGPGTGTSDSIPAMLSNGEFVINAEATRKFLPLLQSINSGSYGRFAGGGAVGTGSSGYPSADSVVIQADEVKLEDMTGNIDYMAGLRTVLDKTGIAGAIQYTKDLVLGHKDVATSATETNEAASGLSESLKGTTSASKASAEATNKLKEAEEELKRKRESIAERVANLAAMDEFYYQEAGLSGAEEMLKSFKTNLSGFLKGDLSFKDMIGGIIDTFTSKIIDTFVDSFVNSIFKGLKLDKLFVDVFSGQAGLGTQIGTKLVNGMANSVTEGASEAMTGFDIGGLFKGIGAFFKGIFKFIGSLFGGFAGAGATGFAEGGLVSGPGTGTSDSILAAVSNGEFVMNAASTRRYLPMLEAMNSGKDLPMFAKGGLVNSRSLRSNSAVNSENNKTVLFNINITGDISRQTRSEIISMLPEITQGVNLTNKELGN